MPRLVENVLARSLLSHRSPIGTAKSPRRDPPHSSIACRSLSRTTPPVRWSAAWRAPFLPSLPPRRRKYHPSASAHQPEWYAPPRNPAVSESLLAEHPPPLSTSLPAATPCPA